MAKTEFSKWLNGKYLDWQREFGRRPVTEFAAWLELESATVNHWLNGIRKPSSPEYVDILAYKLSDLSCYEMLGYPTPDPLILRLKMEWDSLPDETRAAVNRVLEKAEKELERGQEAPKRLSPNKSLG